MPYTDILQRALQLVRRNRALWVFGFLLALTSGGGNGGNGLQFRSPTPPDSFSGAGGELDPAFVVMAVSCLFGFLAILALAFTVLRYVIQVAIIDGAAKADDGLPVRIRAGFRRGWSRQAFLAFLIHLLLGLPIAAAVIAGIIAGLIVMVPTLGIGISQDQPLLVALGVLFSGGLLLVLILIAMIFGILGSMIGNWALREVVLRQAGLVEGLTQGWQLLRSRPQETVIFWFLMTAVGMLTFTGVAIVVLLAAGLVAGIVIPLYAATESIPITALVGGPLGVVMVTGILVLSGLYQAFDQTAWTLAWRHLRGITAQPSPSVPDPMEEGPLLATG